MYLCDRILGLAGGIIDFYGKETAFTFDLEARKA